MRILSLHSILIVTSLVLPIAIKGDAIVSEREDNCGKNSGQLHREKPCEKDAFGANGDGIVGDQGASTGVDPPGSDPESTRPGTSGEGDTTPGEDGTSSEQGDTSPGKGSTNQSPQPCKARGGSFGSFEGDTNVLEFLYELETTTSVTITERVIMPILEQTMVDSVLSEVFSEQCPSTRKRNLRFENNNRKLDVVGISRYPPDIALPGEVCSIPPPEGSSCIVVSSQISLYTDDPNNKVVEADTVLQYIVSLMNSGEYVAVHNDITRVSYIEINPVSAQHQTSSGRVPNSTIGDPETKIGIFVTAACAALVILGAAAYSRRRRTRDDAASSAADSGYATSMYDRAPSRGSDESAHSIS